jgi:hypothetical protein
MPRRPTAFQNYLDQREIPRPRSWRSLGSWPRRLQDPRQSQAEGEPHPSPLPSRIIATCCGSVFFMSMIDLAPPQGSRNAAQTANTGRRQHGIRSARAPSHPGSQGLPHPRHHGSVPKGRTTPETAAHDQLEHPQRSHTSSWTCDFKMAEARPLTVPVHRSGIHPMRTSVVSTEPPPPWSRRSKVCVTGSRGARADRGRLSGRRRKVRSGAGGAGAGSRRSGRRRRSAP